MTSEIKKIIQNALAEDIGKGDITTAATVSHRQKGTAIALAKDDFTVAGINVFVDVFKTLDNKIMVAKKLTMEKPHSEEKWWRKYLVDWLQFCVLRE